MHIIFTIRCYKVSSIFVGNLNLLTILNRRISTILIILRISGLRRSSKKTKR